MFFNILGDAVFDTLIRGTGNIVLGALGVDLRTTGWVDTLIVSCVGVGFWVAFGVLVFFILRWLL